jgi:hypothetical protein
MSKIKIQGNASGTGVVTLTAPNTNTDRTITLPDSTGSILDSTSTLDATKLSGALPAIDGSALTGVGKVLQVVSTDYTGTASSSSGTPSNVSGFSATITPSSTSSKILVMVSVNLGGAQDAYPYILLTRNGTSISIGTSATGPQINTFLNGTITNMSTGPAVMRSASKSYLDSPSSTSSLTYQIQLASPYSGLAGYINRQSLTHPAVYIQRPTSSITLMEIGA